MPNNLVALGINAVDVPDPTESYLKAARVRNLIQQGQAHQQNMALNQERLRAAQLKNQQADIAAKGQQILQSAYAANQGDPDKTMAQLIQDGADPGTVQGYEKHVLGLKKEKLELGAKEFDLQGKKNGQVRGILQQANGMDDATLEANAPVIAAGLQKLIPELKDFSGPLTRDHLKAIELAANTDTSLHNWAAEQRAVIKAKQEADAAAAAQKEAAHKQAMFPAQEQAAESAALKAASEAELAGLKLQGREPEQPHEKAVREETAARDKATQQYRNARLGLESGKKAQTELARKQLADVILEHPDLYDQLTPTEKGHVSVDLAAKGFTGFGKPLGAGEIKKLSESRTAVDDLKTLRKTVVDNPTLIGPVSGLASMIPYATKHKEVQAQMNLVRQRIGKALEGGVLRKEDEEKYKQILSTMTDTPELALSKIDGLIQNIERDTANYTDELRRGGRKVNDPKKSNKDPLEVLD